MNVNLHSVPIPALTDKGLLPIGIHDCSLAEISARFSTSDNRNKRMELWKFFNEYLAVIKPIGVVSNVYVDGGFTTNKPMPKDIDLVLELPPPNPVILPVLMRQEFQQDFVMNRYKMHVWLWHPSAVPPDDWVSFFQEIKPKDLVRLGLKPDARKGILKVVL